MTDSLKERLRTAGLRNGFAIIFYKDVQEALARIEELETDIKDYAYNIDQYQATIAKLEADNKQLRSELSGRLGQPFGDPAKS